MVAFLFFVLVPLSSVAMLDSDGAPTGDECPICMESMDAATEKPFFFGCKHGICGACKERMALRDMDTICPLCRHDDLPLTGTFATMVRLGMRQQAVSYRKQKCFRPDDCVVLTMPNGMVFGIDGQTGEAFRFQAARRPASALALAASRDQPAQATDAFPDLPELQAAVSTVMSLASRTRRLVLQSTSSARSLVFHPDARSGVEAFSLQPEPMGVTAVEPLQPSAQEEASA